MLTDARRKWWAESGIAPGMFDLGEAAFQLNLHEDSVVQLCKVGHLEPLGNPPPGAQRYFAAQYILRLAQDEKWLNKAARLIREHNQVRNATAAKD